MPACNANDQIKITTSEVGFYGRFARRQSRDAHVLGDGQVPAPDHITSCAQIELVGTPTPRGVRGGRAPPSRRAGRLVSVCGVPSLSRIPLFQRSSK
jgi:hypothetical protein